MFVLSFLLLGAAYLWLEGWMGIRADRSVGFYFPSQAVRRVVHTVID